MRNDLWVLIVLVFFISMVCAGLSSASTGTPISNCNELQSMNDDLSGNYYLTQDINCSNTSDWNSGKGFFPVGGKEEGGGDDFSGTFEGNNHSINNLYIDRDEYRIGFFGVINSYAEIRNVGLENAQILVTGGSGSRYVGGLVGSSSGKIVNSYMEGEVKGDLGGDDRLGGLVGRLESNGEIINSHTSGIVSGDGSIGGLLGFFDSGTVRGSYSTANVTAAGSSGGLVGKSLGGNILNSFSTGYVNGSGDKTGGLLGDNYGDGAKVNNSYSTSEVEGKNEVGGLVGDNEYGAKVINSHARGDVSAEERFVGGLVGDNYNGEIKNSYSTGNVSGNESYRNPYMGGLVGRGGGVCESSFWDNQTSGQSTSEGGTGKTTSEMKDQSTFTNKGWDFDSTWEMRSVNDGYPSLIDLFYVFYPRINYLSHDPSPIYVGNEVNITATVSDNGKVDEVLLGIEHDGVETNHTMDNPQEELYVYNERLWDDGYYTYTIYANDTEGKDNRETGNLTVHKINSSIQIQTLEENYKEGDDVDLTDPPSEGDESYCEGNSIIDCSKWNYQAYDDYGYFSTEWWVGYENNDCRKESGNWCKWKRNVWNYDAEACVDNGDPCSKVGRDKEELNSDIMDSTSGMSPRGYDYEMSNCEDYYYCTGDSSYSDPTHYECYQCHWSDRDGDSERDVGECSTLGLCEMKNCKDKDGDGYDTCDPTLSKDTDGLPADCDDTESDDPEVCEGSIDCSDVKYSRCAVCKYPQKDTSSCEWCDMGGGGMEEDVDVSMVMDIGSSMKGSELSSTKESAKGMVDAVKWSDADQMNVVGFDSDSTTVQDNVEMDSEGQEKIKSSIDELSAGGENSLSSGISGGVDSVPSGSHMVLMSDAESGHGNIDEAVQEAKSKDIKIHTVGIGSSGSHDNLKKVAEETGGSYYNGAGKVPITEMFVDMGKEVNRRVKDCGPSTEEGICEKGYQFCMAELGGSTWSRCYGAVYPKEEEKFNGKDDNCDGFLLGGGLDDVTSYSCGDDEVNQYWEECDDGNNIDGDGCSSICEKEEGGEGNEWEVFSYCGDGDVNQDSEECDDGNNQGGDGCTAHCKEETGSYCGDGTVNQDWEECDDGNNVNGDNCSSNCQREYSICGNNETEPGEVCDGSDLGGKDCSDFGFDSSGNPECKSDCSGFVGTETSCGGLNEKENCDDGIDNDLDGDVDCEDSDCEDALACMENCSTPEDTDNDGCTPRYDSDCGGVERNCTDGIDNDCDGLIDGNDPDCGKTTPEENQSKIVNNGFNEINFYLVMNVDYYNETSSSWEFVETVVDDQSSNNLRELKVDGALGLDTVWNSKGWNSSHGKGGGTYRAFAKAVNDEGDVLNNQSGERLTASYNFSIDGNPPSVNIINPVDGITYNYSKPDVDLNVTTDERSDCEYSLDDGSTNNTMTSMDNGTFHHSIISLYPGTNYTVDVYCVDKVGNLNDTESVSFNTKRGPNITVTPIHPTTDMNVTQYEFFNITLNLSCGYKDCGDINLSLDPMDEVNLNATPSQPLNPAMDSYGLTCTDDESNIVDGDLSTGDGCGGSYFSEGCTWQLNWTDVKTLDSVSFYFHAYYNITDVKVSYWDLRNDRWKTPEKWDMGSVSSGEWNSGDLDFPITTKAVRLHGEPTDEGCFELREFQVGDAGYNLKSGLVPTDSSSIPFYTNKSSNPYVVGLNASESETITFLVNSTGSEAVHKFFAYANKTTYPRISDSTDKWNVTIEDVNKPTVEITYPLNKTYDINVRKINYTISDVGADKCWYSKDQGITNSTPVEAGVDFTGVKSSEGQNTWKIYCNDTGGNLASDQVTFTKDTPSLSIEKTYPSGNLYVGMDEFFNITLNVSCKDVDCGDVEITLDQNGMVPNVSSEPFYTNQTPYPSIINLNSSESQEIDLWLNSTGSRGSYEFSAYVNRTKDRTISNSSESWNVTIEDRTKPEVNITYPVDGTEYFREVTNINYTISEVNPSECWYSNESMNSSSVEAGDNFTGVEMVDGDNTISVYCNDTAGNVGKDTITFVESAPGVSVEALYPTDSINITQDDRFNVSLNITCENVDCGDVNVTLNPVTDQIKAKPIKVTSRSGSPTISRALPLKITSGDDSTTGTGKIVLDWSKITDKSDIAIYDEKGNLLDYYIEEFDTTNETAVIWVYRDWVQDGTVQAKIVYEEGSSDQSVSKETVFDKENNLQAGYLLNEESGEALDVTSNNYDGTVNGATQGVDGQVDGAYDFDGSSYVDTNKTASELGVGGSNPKSVTSWVYTESFNNGGVYEMGTQSSGEDFSLRTLSGTNDWRGQFWFADIDFTYDSENKWVFFVITFDGSTHKIYADDGKKMGSSSDGLNTGDSKTFKLGEWSGDYFDGQIDEVKVYNSSLSLNVIKSLYNATKSSPEFFSQKSVVGETNSFYTNKTSNPYTINLNASESETLKYWVNASVSPGDYDFFAYANQTSDTDIGDESDHWNVRVNDNTKPVVNITYPQNKTYEKEVTKMNYTIEESNPSKCWYSTDGGSHNLSLVSAGEDFTSVDSENGLNTWILYCNDTSGNLGKDNVTFNMSAPTVSIERTSSSDIVVDRDEYFTSKFNVSCHNFDCGDINISLYSGQHETSAGDYCQVRGYDSESEGIRDVWFNGIENVENGASDYNDFTSLISEPIERGKNYSLKVSITDSGACNDECGEAYIDWNQDNDWDTGEIYDLGCNSSCGSHKHAINITVPEDALWGSTLMRLKSDTMGDNLDICGNTYNGEVEDYTVYVGNHSRYGIPNDKGIEPFYTNKSTMPFTINLNASQHETVEFDVNSTGTPNDYEFFAYSEVVDNSTINDSTPEFGVSIECNSDDDCFGNKTCDSGECVSGNILYLPRDSFTSQFNITDVSGSEEKRVRGKDMGVKYHLKGWKDWESVESRNKMTLRDMIRNRPRGYGLNDTEIDKILSRRAEGPKEYYEDKVLKFKDDKLGKRFVVEGKFSQSDVNLTDFVIEATNHTTVVNTSDIEGVGLTHKLYVPNTLNEGLYVCPEAHTLTEVTTECENKTTFTHTEAQTGKWKDGIKASINGSYYLVENLTGSGVSQDSNTSSPKFTHIPSNDLINHGNDWRGVDFNATDEDGIDEWFIDDTENFTINQSGHLDDVPYLASRNYQIEVSVNDTSGNVNSTIYQLNVTKNNTSLSLNVSPSQQVSYPTEVTVEGSGCPFGVVCNLYRNSTQVENPYNDTLPEGKYEFVYNTSGNENHTSDNVSKMLTVSSKKASINVTTPLNGSKLPRGKDQPGEDALGVVKDNVSIIAKVYDNSTEEGINGVGCNFYFNDTLVGTSITNSSGHCDISYNKTSESFEWYDIKVNYSSDDLPSDYTASVNKDISELKIEDWSMEVNIENYRAGPKYYETDIAGVNATIKKKRHSF